MAATAEGSIMQALFTRLSALVLTPVLPIAWPNVSFAVPTAKKYLRVQYIPNVNNRIFIGSNDPHQRLGLFQVSVHWPLGQGEAGARDVAGLVAAHFPTDLTMVADGREVRVRSAPIASDMLVGDTEIQIPVTIEYECWA